VKDGFVVTSADDYCLHLYNYKKGSVDKALAFTFLGHDDLVLGVSCNRNSLAILSSAYDKTCKLWNLENTNEIRTFDGHTQRVNCVEWNRLSNKLFSSGSYEFKLWDSEQPKSIQTINLKSTVICVDWSYTNENILAVGLENGTISVHDTRALNTPIFTYKASKRSISKVKFNPHDPELLSIASDDKSVQVADAKNTTITFKFNHTDYTRALLWMNKSNKLLSGSWDKTLWSHSPPRK